MERAQSPVSDPAAITFQAVPGFTPNAVQLLFVLCTAPGFKVRADAFPHPMESVLEDVEIPPVNGFLKARESGGHRGFGFCSGC